MCGCGPETADIKVNTVWSQWLFFKHVYWKLWSAAVKCNCGKYVTISHPVFAETCTEHEHTTDTGNGKKRKSPEFVFFQILFIHKYVHCQEIILFFLKKRCSAPARAKWKWFYSQSKCCSNVDKSWLCFCQLNNPKLSSIHPSIHCLQNTALKIYAAGWARTSVTCASLQPW